MPRAQGTIFISHCSGDKALTAHFSKLIRGVSLNLLDPWFSSDSDHFGGIAPGDRWFDKIRDKMQSSAAIVALITKSSISSKWVFFESGFGAAMPDKKLMLVTHGIASMADIPEPLSKWHAFRVDQPDSLREFCAKLLSLYEISFDETLFAAYSKAFLETTESSKIIDPTPLIEKPIGNESQRLLDHFDKRFFELTSQLHVGSPYINYNIIVESGFDNTSIQVEISDRRSTQDVLDEIWQLIEKYVNPYTYLEKWVLIHERTKIKLIIREISHFIPATAIFKPGSKWVAQKLATPYNPSDSSPERNRRILLE